MLAQTRHVRRPGGRLVRPVADAHAARRRARHHAARRAHPEVAQRLVRDVQCDHRRHRRCVRDGPVGRHHRQRPDHARRRRDRVRHAGDVPHDHDLHRPAARVAADRRAPARHAERRARDLRAVHGRRDRWHRDGVGERPHRAVPRPRDAVARVLRARRQQPPQLARAPRPASSTSCSAASRRRSSSTASPWSTAPTGSTNISEMVLAMQTTVDVDRARTRWRSPASR